MTRTTGRTAVTTATDQVGANAARTCLVPSLFDTSPKPNRFHDNSMGSGMGSGTPATRQYQPKSSYKGSEDEMAKVARLPDEDSIHARFPWPRKPITSYVKYPRTHSTRVAANRISDRAVRALSRIRGRRRTATAV
jgi:hypothetical protein